MQRWHDFNLPSSIKEWSLLFNADYNICETGSVVKYGIMKLRKRFGAQVCPVNGHVKADSSNIEFALREIEIGYYYVIKELIGGWNLD